MWKNFFSSACFWVLLEKNIEIAFFLRFLWKQHLLRFRHQKCILESFKYQKWNLWLILKLFIPGNFFCRTNSFCYKMAQKSPKISFVAFLSIFVIFVKTRFVAILALKMHLEAFKYQKWNLWVILKLFSPGNFFHSTNTFFCK